MPVASEIPEGFSTVTPTLIVSDAAAAIDLYKKAFGATEEYRMACPDTGKIMHACIYFGSSKIFLSDENPNMECSKATHSNFYVYLKDVNSAFSTAKQAGMEEVMPPEDMFWGDRTGSVKDKFGNYWTLATHVRDVSPQEMEEGKKKFAEKMAGKQ